MYFVQPQIRVIHKDNCDQLSDFEDLKGYVNLMNLASKGYHSCQCIRNEFIVARRAKNRNTIERVEYNYLFTPRSKVFHRKTCGLMLSAAEVHGAHYYQTCLLKGRRPCKQCKPVDMDADRRAFAPPQIAISANQTMDQLSQAEQRAINRHRQASAERMVIENNLHISSEKKADLYTLTTSSYTFFAAKGYKFFHLRNCAKVSDLKNLEGFSAFEDACRAGYRPCKHCKPSNKHDIIVSLPTYTIERSGESFNMLIEFCQKNDLMYSEDNGLFCVETGVGIWRLDVSKSPYHLEHINLIKTPDNRSKFHKQPRIFLSPLDALYYIKRHDDSLKFVWNETEYIPVELTDNNEI